MESNKEDIKTILELIKRFLPHFVATRDDLLKLNPSFVISFYKHYVSELVNNCQHLLDCNFENVMEFCPHDVDEEMFNLLFIQQTLKTIGVPYFTICDFYKPSKRTRTTMKVCLNFLFYVKENMPRSQETELSEATYEIGLLKEEFEELNRQYELETSLGAAVSETEVKLQKEIGELQKEEQRLSNYVSTQQHSLNLLNEEIQISDQVVSDDYELCVKRSQQLQHKIMEDDRLMSKNQEELENEHKELDHLKKLNMQIQKNYISSLDCVEQIDSLKKKICNMESDERDVTEQDKVFGKMHQNTADIGKEFQKEVLQLESTLNEKNERINLLDQNIQREIVLLKGLTLELQQLMEKCDNSKAEIQKVQEDQVYLEEECKRQYQRLITCLSSLTTTFDGTLTKALATFQSEND